VQQQVAKESAGVVILALLLPEAEDGVEECADLGGQPGRGEFGLGEPVLEGGSGIAHKGAPCQGLGATTAPTSIKRLATNFLTNPQQNIWC